MLFDNDGNPLVPVHICWSDSEAAVIAALLESHGITALANSQVPHSIWPITADGLGEVQVLVKRLDLDFARQVIANSAENESSA